VPALDLKEATAKLSAEENQSTFAIGTGGSFYTVRLASNSPVEDNLSHGPARGIGKDPWYYWGVYDGHAGWATSAVLRESLIPYVSTHLNALPESSPLSKTVSAIKQAFTHLDDDIFAYARRAIAPNTSATFSESISALAPAIAGSCAIFSAYEPSTSTLHTACTGDSRAVLGRSKPNSTVHTCEPLSVDQNGFNPDEIKRLTELHPNEPEMINPKNGRLLGWALSRAFGDSRGKWTNAEQTTSFEQFWAQKSIEKNKTPPYFTAEPEVTSTTVGNGDFIILASDGLWDHITSEDAVECVSRWAAAVKQGKIDPSGPTKLPRSKFERRPAFEREDEDSRFITWRATPEHFVVEDSNAATHLVKNAFGGSRRALFCGVIGTYSPISRYVRDDVTVQVVFFGD
ncbi:protein serine/threonine phosphatase 2C, partial [Pseudovirgaria hyperparasitica]